MFPENHSASNLPTSLSWKPCIISFQTSILILIVLIKLMSEITVPDQLNSESHVHHISLLFFHCSKCKIHIVKKTQTPLCRSDCYACGYKLFSVKKSYHFSSRGSSNTFPLPEATHSSLDPILSPLKRMFSRTHSFFMSHFYLCLPHKASLQNFLTRGLGAK